MDKKTYLLVKEWQDPHTLEMSVSSLTKFDGYPSLKALEESILSADSSKEDKNEVSKLHALKEESVLIGRYSYKLQESKKCEALLINMFPKLSRFAVEMYFYANRRNYCDDWEDFNEIVEIEKAELEELGNAEGLEDEWDVVKEAFFDDTFTTDNLSAFFDKTCDEYFLRSLSGYFQEEKEFADFKKNVFIHEVEGQYCLDDTEVLLSLLEQDFDSMAMEAFISRLANEIASYF